VHGEAGLVVVPVRHPVGGRKFLGEPGRAVQVRRDSDADPARAGELLHREAGEGLPFVVRGFGVEKRVQDLLPS